MLLSILMLGEQVLTIFLFIKRVRFNWNFIVNDVQIQIETSTKMYTSFLIGLN